MGDSGGSKLERVKGIEPSSQAWEARILPLNHTRFHCASLYQILLARNISFGLLARTLSGDYSGFRSRDMRSRTPWATSLPW